MSPLVGFGRAPRGVRFFFACASPRRLFSVFSRFSTRLVSRFPSVFLSFLWIERLSARGASMFVALELLPLLGHSWSHGALGLSICSTVDGPYCDLGLDIWATKYWGINTPVC